MRKFIFIITTVSLLISISFATSFSDISGHWAEYSILMSYHNDLLSGYSDNTFRPNNTITRAEFITILSKVLDSTLTIDIDSYENLYTYDDLPDSHWCKPFYNKLMYYGHIFSNEKSYNKFKGNSFIRPILGNLFNPSSPITRAEAVSLIAYFLDDDMLINNESIAFSDISDSPLKPSIEKFCKTGIVKGYSDRTFKPDNTITRAEVAKIIYDIFIQKQFFKEIDWYTEVNSEDIYSENNSPEDTLTSILNLEYDKDYVSAYQLLSANYKLIHDIYDYKDYMKTPSSWILSNANFDFSNKIQKEKITMKKDKDNSITLSIKDSSNQSYSIDLIEENSKYYINSKLY